MNQEQRKYLSLLAEKFPTRQAVCTEIINLAAIMNLPKGTEHFMSDIHGEYDAFLHIMNNCSGVIREKIEMIFADVLNDTEKRALRTLIYYPKEALQRLHSEGRISPKWYRETLRHMIEIARVLSSKYTRSKVRKAMPKEFGYIIDELLHALPDEDGWGDLADHNRQRRYPVDIGRPYLVDLGIVGRTGALVPAMARKWRQINKFVEIVAQAWQHNTLADRVGRAGQPPLRIRDYGAGKGYLTFALYDHLTHALGMQVEMVGIERRADLVALCNRLAQRHGLSGLRFEKGDILQACEVAQVASAAGGTVITGIADGRAAAGVAGVGADAEQSRDSGATASDEAAVDIVIALHACDTATDDALFQGIRQQAAMLVCSPCCHRELRQQLKAPAPLDALLRHGIHLGQEAEMLTDGLRALLLETQGYEAQVFEFISPEHTGKNKMILGNRTGRARDADAVRAEIEALKRFYGIRTQRLDGLLGGGMSAAGNPGEN